MFPHVLNRNAAMLTDPRQTRTRAKSGRESNNSAGSRKQRGRHVNGLNVMIDKNVFEAIRQGITGYEHGIIQILCEYRRQMILAKKEAEAAMDKKTFLQACQSSAAARVRLDVASCELAFVRGIKPQIERLCAYLHNPAEREVISRLSEGHFLWSPPEYHGELIEIFEGRPKPERFPNGNYYVTGRVWDSTTIITSSSDFETRIKALAEIELLYNLNS